jgi:hypothetical protein
MHDSLTRLADVLAAMRGASPQCHRFADRIEVAIRSSPDDGRPVDGWDGLAPSWAFYVMGEDDFIIRLENSWFRGKSHRMITNDEFIEACQAKLATPPTARPEVEKCETCGGNGIIGGPSFREPDEGGVPCPDCSVPVRCAGEVDAQPRPVRDYAAEAYLHGHREGMNGTPLHEDASEEFMNGYRAGEQAKAEGDDWIAEGRSREAAIAYVRDWCPDHVKDYVAELTAPKPAGCEAVGETYTMEALVPGGEVRCHAMLNRPLPPGTKLYAQPQAVAVDDAMLDRAFEAHADFIDKANRDESLPLMDRLREAMRCALLAALAPGGEGKTHE